MFYSNLSSQYSNIYTTTGRGEKLIEREKIKADFPDIAHKGIPLEDLINKYGDTCSTIFVFACLTMDSLPSEVQKQRIVQSYKMRIQSNAMRKQRRYDPYHHVRRSHGKTRKIKIKRKRDKQNNYFIKKIKYFPQKFKEYINQE